MQKTKTVATKGATQNGPNSNGGVPKIIDVILAVCREPNGPKSIVVCQHELKDTKGKTVGIELNLPSTTQANCGSRTDAVKKKVNEKTGGLFNQNELTKILNNLPHQDGRGSVRVNVFTPTGKVKVLSQELPIDCHLIPLRAIKQANITNSGGFIFKTDSGTELPVSPLTLKIVKEVHQPELV